MSDKRQTRVEIILTIIGLLMILGLIALIIIMLAKKPKKRYEIKVEDIPLASLESFDFIDNKTIPEYPHLCQNLRQLSGQQLQTFRCLYYLYWLLLVLSKMGSDSRLSL